MVVYAQPNRRLVLRETFPNDLYFPDQWSMNNTGQFNGFEDADIDAPEAWDIAKHGVTAQGDTIVIAIIDDGFDLNHDDIDFFKNYDEIPDNGIDDDGNGFVDDFDGWNAYGHNGNITNRDHGSHVSGIAGAIGDNEIGVCGVVWGGRIMPISGTEEVEATLVECYDYALTMRKLYNQTNGEKGAFVVSTNISWGIDEADPDDFPIWCAIYDSLGHYGILSAGATANANYNIDEVGDMPTACDSPYLISVTNTTNLDEKHPSAGYGLETIDLGAPGTYIYSTRQGNTYGFKSGTSMSTPHVAGAVALLFAAADEELLSRYHNDPSTIGLLFKDAILQTTDTLPSLLGSTTTGGRLNLHKALQYIQTPPAPAELGFTVDTLLFSLKEGEKDDISLDLYNYSNFEAPLSVTIAPISSWIDISLENDTIPATGSVSLTVWFDTDGLQLGVYSTKIQMMTSGAITELPVKFTVTPLVGIDVEVQKLQIAFVKNPVENQILEMVVDSKSEKILTMEVYSLDGEFLLSRALFIPYGKSILRQSIASKGLHFILIRHKHTIIKTEKVLFL